MLTKGQVAYTGPYSLPSGKHKSKGPTAEALKRAMKRLGAPQYEDSKFGDFDEQYNEKLEAALDWWDKGKDGYAEGRYDKLRGAKTKQDEYALDQYARALINNEAKSVVPPSMLFPVVGQCERPSYLHPTSGLPGNWALDFMAKGGCPVVAPEAAKIKKLSGRNPIDGADQIAGLYGWSIHFETPAGYRYFSTHYGSRTSLDIGQSVKAGQKLGEVGWWPGDPGRSHLHLGVTSPYGEIDARDRIRLVAASPRKAG